MPSPSAWHGLVKYFEHGLAFSILFFLLYVGWAGLTLVLVACGLFLGLAIGLVLFFAFTGYVNAFVTQSLWFPVRTGFWTCLGHGFLLFLALAPVNLAVLGIRYLATPSLGLSLILFIATAPLTGFIAKAVGSRYEVSSRTPPGLGSLPPGLGEEASAPPSSFDYPRK